MSRPTSLRRAPEWDSDYTSALVLSGVLHALAFAAIVVMGTLIHPRPLPIQAYTVELTDGRGLGGRLPPGPLDRPLGGPHAGGPKPSPAPTSASPAAESKPVEAPKPPEPMAKAPPEPPKPEPPKAEPRPEPKPEPPPKPEAVKVPEPKPEPKPEAKPEPKPEPKPEAKPPPKPEAKPEPKKPEEPQPEAKKPEPAKPEPKKPEEPQPEAKKPEAKKPEPAQPEPKKPASAATPAAKPAARPTTAGAPGATGAAESPAAEGPPRDAYAAAMERRLKSMAGGGGLGGTEAGTGPIGAGGPGGGGGQMVGLEFIRYRQQVIETVKAQWANALRRPGLVVKVQFAIAADGAVSDVHVAQSSGDAAYDSSALRAVQKANPLPAPPPQYKAQFSEFLIEFHSEEGGQGAG